MTTTTTVAVVGTIKLEIKFTSSISPDMTAEEIDILLGVRKNFRSQRLVQISIFNHIKEMSPNICVRHAGFEVTVIILFKLVNCG